MPELLTGTVTFLFSDIERSTRLVQAQGPGWPAMLARHQELLRAAFTAESGVEVGTEGDSFFVTFPTAPGAVAAAVAAQRALAGEPWPDGLELRVRMGMHTGEASFGTEGYVGLHVHRASRIASAGRGGQVLLSDTTRSLVADSLPPGVELRDLGVHRLKDLERPERLWQLVVSDLQTEFPPIASLDAVPNNLPTRLTTFLGREREMAAISALLSASRLLTLTGPGGTGKTRLSLEVAGRSLVDYPDGIFFVELAPISQAELVPATIAQTLGLPDRGGRNSIDRLVDHIGDGRVLLVLDNFEQVSEAAPSVNTLLTACPNLTVLVSSRSILHVSGEQEYPVPPLGLPDPQHLPPLTQLSQFEAVALFIERARSVKPDFDVTNENAPALAEICVRLDGLPLAIELAAARIRIFTPQAMLGRLEHRLGLLAGGSRDLPERQQTLRGAIAWSHDMLDDTDRALFACLSVFVGGAGIDAIEHICGGEVTVDVLDVLASLVEKSLVRQSEGVDGQPRFTMLETIREFAVEQAVGRGRWEQLRLRHAEWFASVAESSAPNLMSSGKGGWLDRLEQDHDNLRMAASWAIETGAAEIALRICSALWRFWQMRGYLAEGFARVQQALALPHGRDHPAARADALSAAAGLAYWLADSERARAFYLEEIEARTELGDRRGLAEAHYGVSFTWAIIDVDLPENFTMAIAHINAALEIFREIGDESGIGRCNWALATVEWGTRDIAAALEHARDALKVFEAIDDQFMVGWSSYTLGLAELSEDGKQGDGGSRDYLAKAQRSFEQALRVFGEAQDVSGYTLVLDGLAMVALRNGDLGRAARLSGAVARLEQTSGTGLNLWNREVLGFQPEALRDNPDLADDWAAGEAMTAAEAVAYALED
ncbi:MAG: adenylate/guanylate cyclase domain-containing protein [Candidatus Limnocylindria bacterium]